MRLVAVTKTVDVERILAAIAAGVTDIGENRVQEAARKDPDLPGHVRRHLIGHLQTNKAARAASLFDVVHSVDGERVATALATRRPAGRTPREVLLEVELTGVPTHTGFVPDAVEQGVREVAAVDGLRLRGLMTMAPLVEDVEEARPTFRRLRELRDRVQDATGIALPELSMGMSDDFEVAVEEGATMVRLGRVLFGGRAVPAAV